MNRVKLCIYIAKAALAPIVVATALWAKDDTRPTLWVALALLVEATWQGINAAGAFLSEPAKTVTEPTK